MFCVLLSFCSTTRRYDRTLKNEHTLCPGRPRPRLQDIQTDETGRFGRSDGTTARTRPINQSVCHRQAMQQPNHEGRPQVVPMAAVCSHVHAICPSVCDWRCKWQLQHGRCGVARGANVLQCPSFSTTAYMYFRRLQCVVVKRRLW